MSPSDPEKKPDLEHPSDPWGTPSYANDFLECPHEYRDGRSAVVPTDDPRYHRCAICGDDTFQAVPDEALDYGISPKQLERLLEKHGITLEGARALRDKIFERYPQLRKTVKELGADSHVDRLNRTLSSVGTHVLKTWPEYYEAVARGEKTFEVRRNDRDFHVGDTLVLQEWDPETEEYSGRRLSLRVTYVLKDDEFGMLSPGVVVMGLARHGNV
jgi:hypothetical protein